MRDYEAAAQQRIFLQQERHDVAEVTFVSGATPVSKWRLKLRLKNQPSSCRIAYDIRRV